MIRSRFILIFLFSSFISEAWGWGFLAHKQINKHAVFTLPPAMFTFYKAHIRFITENAINPDKRCYVIEGEAPRHYIDLEYYGDSVLLKTSQYWHQAVKSYTKDMLLQHGILPWHIFRMKKALTEAFRQQNVYDILRLSADLGHYIADANVPLHTSENYNGQLTGQEGIHELWETRLPEIFLDGYDFFIGKAEYVDNPQERAWEAIMGAHRAVSDVLVLERKLSENFLATKQYSFEQKGSTLKKVYSIAYVFVFFEMLNGQIERQIRASVKMVEDY